VIRVVLPGMSDTNSDSDHVEVGDLGGRFTENIAEVFYVSLPIPPLATFLAIFVRPLLRISSPTTVSKNTSSTTTAQLSSALSAVSVILSYPE